MTGRHDADRVPPVIGPAGESDAERVSALIGVAFQPLEVARWLVPDPARRGRVLPVNFRIHVDHALAYGQVHVTADGAGAAVWFHRDGPEPPPEPADYPRRLAAACGEYTERFELLDALFERHHPTAPHHHLAFLAVRPDRQGRGIGTALLAHHHAHLDRDRTASYLEASSPPARDLYLRLGYRVRQGPFRLPDGTPLWPMWREPASTATAHQPREHTGTRVVPPTLRM